MPVVELNINRIRKLVSGNVTRKQILDVLPFLGLDIESEEGDEIIARGWESSTCKTILLSAVLLICSGLLSPAIKVIVCSPRDK